MTGVEESWMKPLSNGWGLCFKSVGRCKLATNSVELVDGMVGLWGVF